MTKVKSVELAWSKYCISESSINFNPYIHNQEQKLSSSRFFVKKELSEYRKSLLRKKIKRFIEQGELLSVLEVYLYECEQDVQEHLVNLLRKFTKELFIAASGKTEADYLKHLIILEAKLDKE